MSMKHYSWKRTVRPIAVGIWVLTTMALAACDSQSTTPTPSAQGTANPAMHSPINRTAIPGRGLVTIEPDAATTPAAMDSPVMLPGAQENPAVAAARKALANKLKVAESDIKLIGADEVQWPDGCLGVQQPGVMCTQVIVDGFSVALEYNGTRYEYHTDIAGKQVILASPRD